ncbi:MAG: hypothetical protein SAK29_23755 [Scytonema sp. PMC 1069.18]|nr:hypothetical protein [Scytonema sp. PMC 1069.18]MEC4885198.1 hypothetical protein [Scytonema sp. PMC 1070.18]
MIPGQSHQLKKSLNYKLLNIHAEVAQLILVDRTMNAIAQILSLTVVIINTK